MKEKKNKLHFVPDLLIKNYNDNKDSENMKRIVITKDMKAYQLFRLLEKFIAKDELKRLSFLLETWRTRGYL